MGGHVRVSDDIEASLEASRRKTSAEPRGARYSWIFEPVDPLVVPPGSEDILSTLAPDQRLYFFRDLEFEGEGNSEDSAPLPSWAKTNDYTRG